MNQINRPDRGGPDKISKRDVVTIIGESDLGYFHLELLTVRMRNPADLHQCHREKGLFIRRACIPVLGRDLAAGITQNNIKIILWRSTVCLFDCQLSQQIKADKFILWR
ncbi:hypothetical protein D3C75_731670 [compost metagenome]